MNKKILAAAIATALAAPLAAMAADDGNVTLYGQANVSVDSIDAGPDKQTTNVSTNQSVLGVKGWEGLGNGLKAVFHWDVFVGVDDGQEDIGGSNSFFGASRDSWVGLEGGFGTVALGAQGRPWKTATNDTDIFVNTIADYASIIGTTSDRAISHDSGIGNSVIWFLPNMSGFSGHLQYGTDESDTTDTNSWGAQFNYTNGGWRVTYAYDLQEGADTGSTDVDANKVSVSYTFAGATTISAIYDNINSDAAASRAERDAFWLGLSHNMGNNTFKAAYASADESDVAGGNDGADFWALGVSHHFSKRTEVYALYANTDNDSAASYGLGFGNATSASSSGNSNPSAAGEDVSAFSVGLHHNF